MLNGIPTDAASAFSGKVQAFFRTGVHAFSAADTLWRAGNLVERKSHRTGLFAGHAGNAELLFPMNLHQAESVEPAVNCPQWTQILAKRPINFDGEQDNSK